MKLILTLAVLALFVFPGLGLAESGAEDLALLPAVPPMDIYSKLLLWIVSVNLFLSGLQMALGKVMNFTESKVDNKIFDILSKVLAILSKIIDFGSANVAHKKIK